MNTFNGKTFIHLERVYNVIALILWEINTKRFKHNIETYLNWKAVYYSSLLASVPIGHHHVPIQVHTTLLWPYSAYA